ncbi:TonB-dependent receptor [Sphingobacterium sp. CZ-2]|uniref:TonB-dependent receptor n=1 Tax=Sphingobacterium sp. CZ-2 TaxID=2557994 RepID=UPI00106F6C70|nr:TonB-dependent receptor [Sphingobacterium sp. CZ-2]QBR12955.1 TonB-dependent receptor [Sphingobacterium sp. CZ-2]
MRYFLLFVGFALANLVHAQNNAEIKGRVFDGNKKPLEKATVSIVSEKDSLVLSYSLTDDKGNFDFVRIPSQKPIILYVSYVNNPTYQKPLQLKAGEKLQLDSIIMGGNMIDEILITAVPPIRLNGDTLEYKADYFKTRPNATVEELLQILPGIQVNADGSIFYQGREVSGIRVNNKDFFVQDMKIATKNLDASLIDVVQVIKDKGESKREILDDTNLPIVINLKMKKEFLKADFGKFYGGAATRERYESGALINTFRDTLQISFIGFANNIGRSGFDYSELSQYGGLGRGENSNFMMYGSAGLMNQISSGINVNYDIAKKLKTNLYYNFAKDDHLFEQTDLNNRFYDEITDRSRSSGNSESHQIRHEMRAFARYHVDTTAQVSLDLRLNTGSNNFTGKNESVTWRNENDPVRDVNTYNLSNNKNINFNYRVNAEKRLQNKMLLSVEHQYSRINQDIFRNNDNWNRYYLLGDSIVDQTERSNVVSYTQNLKNRISLQVPLNKDFNFDVFAQFNVDEEEQLEELLNRLNNTEFVNRDDVANNKNIRNTRMILGTSWNIKVIKDFPISFALTYQNLANRFEYFDKLPSKNEAKGYFLPNVNLAYKGLSASYSRSVNPPSFSQIIVLNNDMAPTVMVYASPYFENVIRNDFSLRYYKSFTKSKTYINASVSYGVSDNSIISDQYYNVADGTSSRQNIQASDIGSLFWNGSLSQTFLQNKTWRLAASINGYFSMSDRYARINGEENMGKNSFGNISGNITFSYKDNLTISPNYNYSRNGVEYKDDSPNFRSVNNITHNFGSSILVNNIKKFRLEGSYTLSNLVTGIDNKRGNRHLVNASVYYPVLGKGELKFSVFDLLNQRVYNNYYASGNSNGFRTSVNLRQYFMLGMVYKFLNTGDKK